MIRYWEFECDISREFHYLKKDHGLIKSPCSVAKAIEVQKGSDLFEVIQLVVDLGPVRSPNSHCRTCKDSHRSQGFYSSK